MLKSTLIHKVEEFDISQYESDYSRDGLGIFSNDTKLIIKLNSLPKFERKLLIIYAEMNSTRAIGNMFGCSATQIKSILKEIKKEFN